MSVSIKSFCETHDNEFAHLLEKCMENCTFLESTILEFANTSESTMALLKIGYTLSALDLRQLFIIFDERFWGIRPMIGDVSYEFYVFLKDTDL